MSLSKGLEGCDGRRLGSREEGESRCATAFMAFPFPLRIPGNESLRGLLRLPSRVPSSGSSAMRVRAVIDPTPGTDARRSSFSRHAGDPRTPASMSPSISESSFSSRGDRRAMLLRIRMAATRFSRLRSATIISMIWRQPRRRGRRSSCVASSASGRSPAWSPRQSGRSCSRRPDRFSRGARAPGRSGALAPD